MPHVKFWGEFTDTEGLGHSVEYDHQAPPITPETLYWLPLRWMWVASVSHSVRTASSTLMMRYSWSFPRRMPLKGSGWVLTTKLAGDSRRSPSAEEFHGSWIMTLDSWILDALAKRKRQITGRFSEVDHCLLRGLVQR